jgi:hypothetical protein
VKYVFKTVKLNTNSVNVILPNVIILSLVMPNVIMVSIMMPNSCLLSNAQQIFRKVIVLTTLINLGHRVGVIIKTVSPLLKYVGKTVI